MDDNQMSNDIFRILWLKSGLDGTLKFIGSAESAILNLKESKEIPDCLVLDIHLPGMDGWYFLDWLLKEQYDIPVIVFTSSVNISDRLTAHRYEKVVDFIVKPMSLEKMFFHFGTPSSRG